MRKKYLIIIITTVIVLGGLAFSEFYYRTTYNSLTHPIAFLPFSASSDHNPEILEKAAERTDKLEIVMVYKHGCRLCNSVQKQAVAAIRSGQAAHKDFTYIMAEGHSKAVKRYGYENGVVHTPTVLVKYHGVTVYRYTGANKRHITRILSGKNPNTGIELSRSTPILTVVQNDLDGTLTTQPAGTTPSF